MRALAALVEEHTPFLYRYAYRLSGSEADAEDLLQQTFLMAQRHGDQLRDSDKARNWLCVILRNAFLKQIRKQREYPLSTVADFPEPAESTSWEAPVDSAELQTALAELPDEYRLPLVMFYFEELGYAQIAEQLNIPLGTVMSRLSRAKAALKRRLAPVSTGP